MTGVQAPEEQGQPYRLYFLKHNLTDREFSRRQQSHKLVKVRKTLLALCYRSKEVNRVFRRTMYEDRTSEFKEKSSEVDALMRLYGVLFDRACQYVCLNPKDYRAGCSHIDWLPSPSLIDQLATEIREAGAGYDIDVWATDEEHVEPIVATELGTSEISSEFYRSLLSANGLELVPLNCWLAITEAVFREADDVIANPRHIYRRVSAALARAGWSDAEAYCRHVVLQLLYTGCLQPIAREDNSIWDSITLMRCSSLAEMRKRNRAGLVRTLSLALHSQGLPGHVDEDLVGELLEDPTIRSTGWLREAACISTVASSKV